jgi:hypothetical protein
VIRAAALAALIAAPSAFAFGMWSGQNTMPPATLTAARQNAPLVAKPGWAVDGAAKYLARLNPPPPPPPPLKVAGPPAPDVAVILRREVRAVMSDEAGAPSRVLLTGARTLKLGDTYGEGWRLTKVSTQAVTLSKGNQIREVDLFTPAPGGPSSIGGGAFSTIGPISFTNGQKAGALSAAQLAQLTAMLRQSGMSEAQIKQLTDSLKAGGAVGPQQLLPLLMALSRSAAVRPAQVSQFLDSLGRSGVITPAQAAMMSQQVAAVGQNNQLNALVQQLGQRGGGGFPGGGGRGGRGGFGGGGGGPNGGFNRPEAPTLPAPPPPVPGAPVTVIGR